MSYDVDLLLEDPNCEIELLKQSDDKGYFCAHSRRLDALNAKYAGSVNDAEGEPDDDPPAHHIALLCTPDGSCIELDGDRRRRGAIRLSLMPTLDKTISFQLEYMLSVITASHWEEVASILLLLAL